MYVKPRLTLYQNEGNHNCKKDQTTVQSSLVLVFFWFHELDLQTLVGNEVSPLFNSRGQCMVCCLFTNIFCYRIMCFNITQCLNTSV